MPSQTPSESKIQVAGRMVGGGSPCFLIGEVAQAHDGSLGQAHAFIDLAAATGLDAIKFQTHIASEESTLDEPFRVKFSRQDNTRFDYWKRMEFTSEQWRGLAIHAKEKSLIFLSSPFSVAAVNLLQAIGMPAWKIGSGECRSRDLLDAILATGNPVLLSTGMSSFTDVEAEVSVFRKRSIPHALFQCTSEYPVSPERVGIQVIQELRDRFGCPVGLSDHSGTIYPSLMAMARGADLIEVHMAFDLGMFGPDVRASLTPDGLKMLVEARNQFHRMSSHPVDKDSMARELAPLRAIFSKSLAPVRPLPRGTVIEPEMLTSKKPGTGFAPDKLNTLLGRRLTRDVSPDRLLRPEDFE